MSLDSYPTSSVLESSNHTNIKTATTTTVKASAGRLAGVVVNGGTMGSVTIYDNSAGSGTKIATVAAPLAGMVLPYGCRVTTGITVVTAAATNLTVIWS